MSEACIGGCGLRRDPLRDLRRTAGDEPLPVPRLPAQERHRARLLLDLPEPTERETERPGEALGHRWRQRQCEDRAFYPACGSPVYLTFAARPELFTIHAASLDDPRRYKPQMVTYGVRGYAWDHVGAALPKFDRMPPSG
jgi:hypothetical protein